MTPTLALFLWLAASVTLGLAGCVALQAGALQRSAYGEAGGEVALFVFKIGVPFLAVISGALSLDLLGLGTDWFDASHVAGFEPADWLRGTGAAALAVAFVSAVLWLAGREVAHARLRSAPVLARLRDAAYDQVHWAFYRSPFVLAFGDAYWGAVAGFAVIVAERLIQRRVAPALAGSRADDLAWLLRLLTSSVLYLATQNLWLMIAADLALRLLAARLWPARRDAGDSARVTP